MQKLIIKSNDWIEFPQDIIDNAPSSGPFDDYAEHLVNNVFDVETTLQDTIDILKPFGAWENSELQDLDDNIARILWLAILNCKENETNIFYLGE